MFENGSVFRIGQHFWRWGGNFSKAAKILSRPSISNEISALAKNLWLANNLIHKKCEEMKVVKSRQRFFVLLKICA